MEPIVSSDPEETPSTSSTLLEEHWYDPFPEYLTEATPGLGWTDYTLAPSRLAIEMYGSVADRHVVDLTETLARKEFRYAPSHLVVEGTLISAFPSGGAVVDLQEVSWRGVALCEAGTYVLPAEE